MISPVEVFKERPAGSDGAIEYTIGATPPEVLTGVNGVALVPVLSETGVDDPALVSAGLPVNTKVADEDSAGDEESVAVTV